MKPKVIFRYGWTKHDERKPESPYEIFAIAQWGLAQMFVKIGQSR